jgi:hypothetical protein
VKPVVVFVGDWRVWNEFGMRIAECRRKRTKQNPFDCAQVTPRRVRPLANKVVNHIMSQQPRLKRSEIPPSRKVTAWQAS